jgi:hypothetical protein
MARNFRVEPLDYIDYLPAGARGSRSSSGKKTSPFGDLEVLPEDYSRLDQKLSDYYGKANAIATEIQRNPGSYKDLYPNIRQLSYDLQRDLTSGEIAAMVNSKKEYDQFVKEIMEDGNMDPEDKLAYLNNLKVDQWNYDPTTGRGRKFMPPRYTPTASPEDMEKYFRETTKLIGDETITLDNGKTFKIRDLGDIGLTDVGAIETAKGKAKEKIEALLTQSVPAEWAESLQRKRKLQYDRGEISQEEYESYDERNYLNEDGTPNTNTTIGKRIASYAENAATKEINQRVVTSKKASGTGKMARASAYNDLHNDIMKVILQKKGYGAVLGDLRSSKTAPGAVSVEIEDLGATYIIQPDANNGFPQPVEYPAFKLTIKGKLTSAGRPSVKEIVVDGPEKMDEAYWTLFGLLSNTPNQPLYDKTAMREARNLNFNGKTMTDVFLENLNIVPTQGTNVPNEEYNIGGGNNNNAPVQNGKWNAGGS